MMRYYLNLQFRGQRVKKGFPMSIHEPANYNFESAYVLSTKWTQIACVPPEPAESSLHPPSSFFQINFNITISPTPHYSKRLFSLTLSNPQYVCISLPSVPHSPPISPSWIWSSPRITYVIFNVFFAIHKSLSGTLVIQLSSAALFPFHLSNF